MKISNEVDLNDLCENMKDNGNYYIEEDKDGRYLEINKKTRKVRYKGCSSVILFWLMVGIAIKG